MSDPQEITDNQAESRFEATIDGRRAELLYRRNGNRLVLIHTEVPVQAEGHGLGGGPGAGRGRQLVAGGQARLPLRCGSERPGDHRKTVPA